jgi:ATP-dependent DNA helicase RecG
MRMDGPIEQCFGVGEKTAERFHRLGVHTVADLLRHYPVRYDQMPAISLISDGPEGKTVAVRCTVEARPSTSFTSRGKLTMAVISDRSGRLKLGWFNQPFMEQVLRPRQTYVFRGVISRQHAEQVMFQPELFMPGEYEALIGRPRPVYLLTDGLSARTIRKVVAQVLPEMDGLPDNLPASIRDRYGLCPLAQAIRQVHAPDSFDGLLLARRRLVFDEFLSFILGVRSLRSAEPVNGGCRTTKAAWAKKLLLTLPYKLTAAQMRVWNELQGDLEAEAPMNRLIQGDVGSGKTILAVLALITAAENGFQGALMVPTEVLARQHYEKLVKLKEDSGLPFTCVLATGGMKPSERREADRRIRSGEADIIIGTHALFQEGMDYARLGLVVTDEQHRFGVRQRAFLAEKGAGTNILVMSATPIPRTLAMILYGDMDVSVLDEKPSDRLPVKNAVIMEVERDKAVRFLKNRIEEGRQGYVICPLVEKSEGMDAADVISCAARLRKELPSCKVGVLHGRMKPAEKQSVMARFQAGEISVLVSTTVVEVGVDVPNATVMIIEDAERFGLAQLHQLRGRIGRGREQSYCIFINGSEDREENVRLEVLKKENDGFRIAEQDLKLRGPGDLLGARQSGDPEFVLADVLADGELLVMAAEAADSLLEEARNSGDMDEYLRRLLGGRSVGSFSRAYL